MKRRIIDDHYQDLVFDARIKLKEATWDWEYCYWYDQKKELQKLWNQAIEDWSAAQFGSLDPKWYALVTPNRTFYYYGVKRDITKFCAVPNRLGWIIEEVNSEVASKGEYQIIYPAGR